MGKRICPGCGSEYFMLSKGDKSSAFQVNLNYEMSYIAQPSVESEECGDTKSILIHCAACSWRGSMGELVESHTG